MKQNHYYFWCAFQAHEQNSITIQYFALTIQIILFSTLIYAYRKAKKLYSLQQHSQHLIFIYKLIISWLICLFLQSLINVISYFVFINKSPSNIDNYYEQNDQQDINLVGLRVLSGLVLFLDVMSAYLLQMTMLYIPYLWMRNYIQLLSQYNLCVQDRIKINKISIFLGIINKYMLFRVIYIIYFVVVVFMVILTDIFKQYSKYITIASLLQSLVILIMHLMGLYAWNFIKKIVLFNKQQIKLMYMQYIILLLCNFVRIVINILQYFSGLVNYIPDKYCYDDHDQNQTIMNCVFLSCNIGLMHIVPGCIILYVYWPGDNNKNKIGLKKSLLVSQQQNVIK